MYVMEPARRAASGVWEVWLTVVLTPGSWVGVRNVAWGSSFETQADSLVTTSVLEEK